MRKNRRFAGLAMMLAFAATFATFSGARAASPCASGTAGGDWSAYGHDLANTRNQPDENTISAASVGNLHLLYKVAASGGSYRNTPLVSDGCLYLASGNGAVESRNADTGDLNWSRTFVGNGLSLIGDTITGSPALGAGRVFAAIGNTSTVLNGGKWSYEVALWQSDNDPHCLAASWVTDPASQCLGGKAAWPGETGWGALSGNSGTVIDTTADTFVVASPVYYNPAPSLYPDGLIYQGFMGQEGNANPRGGWVILNATDGSVVLRDYTISAADYATGHRGASIWSTSAVDTATNYIYSGTGNPASQFEDVNANSIVKIDGDPTRATFGQLVGTYHGLPDNYAAAVDLYHQALCENTGSVRVIWGQTCGQQDLDFGAAPNVFTSGGVTMVGDLQKAGVYHAVRADAFVPCAATCSTPAAWTQIVGTPGFPQNSNSASVADGHVFVAAQMPGQLWKLDASSGCTPPTCARTSWVSPMPDGLHYNPVSTANGLVYTGDSSATLRVLDAATGVPMFVRNANQEVSNATDAASSDGVAIARNKVYWAVAGNLLVLGL